MRNRNKISLSIGIPAYNEEGNIGNLLKSILSQNKKSYVLEKIYVVCGGCTDKTSGIVKVFSKINRQIQLFDKRNREGKIAALEFIYKLNKSDLILTLDADIIFQKRSDIDLMVEGMLADERINFVGPLHEPVSSDTRMSQFARISYLTLRDAFLRVNDGNNYYAVMCAYLLRRSFSKSIKYPKGVHADQTLLYGYATKDNIQGFKLIKEAVILFRTVTTFKDWRLLAVRSVSGDRENFDRIFDDKKQEVFIPKKFVIFSLLKWFFKDPINTTGSFLMNIYIRKFPLKDKMPQNGMWEITKSSKFGIRRNGL